MLTRELNLSQTKGEFFHFHFESSFEHQNSLNFKWIGLLEEIQNSTFNILLIYRRIPIVYENFEIQL